MTPDTLEGSIHDLTQNILADYTAGRPIDRIEPFNQPDRDVIIALIGKLRRIVFPGYFRDPAYHVYSAAHSLSALIEDTAYLLQKQIAIALRCGSSVTQEAAADIDRQAQEMTVRFLEKIPDVRALLATDLQAFYDGDPAATSLDEIIIAYPGLLAITVNRLAHELFLLKVPLIPRIMTEFAHGRTGIDIHPGATIGKYFFIDHGTGIVVGETTIIGDSVKLYQGVTLGGNGKETGKRHPTLKDNVMVSAGAKIIGSFTIGENSKIGAGSVVIEEVPPNCTVVGVPGHIVKQNDVRIPRKSMDHIHLPDPIFEDIKVLQQENTELTNRVLELEGELRQMRKKERTEQK